jgi:hypothetical protein
LASTTPLALPYPTAADAPNGPAQIQALAEAAQTILGRETAALQAGVLDAGSFEVTQASGGASMVIDIASNVGRGAFVQQTSTSLLFPVAAKGSKSTVTATTAHATLPRVDRVVVSMAGVVSLVAGTATSGATLDNLTGAASVPSDSLLLADVLVPATDTTLSNSQIRDRRKWSRGAFCRIARTSNAAAGNDYSVTSTTMAALDATNIKPRIECSGAPLRVRLLTTLTTTGTYVFSPQIDGVGMDGMANDGGSSATQSLLAQNSELTASGLEWVTVPTAGSHRIYPAFAVSTGGNTLTLRAQAAAPLLWIVEEILTQNTANNATTTG